LPPLCAQEIKITPQYFKIQNFKFISGKVLKEMTVEYGAIGTKQTDKDGNIMNAIVCHGWSGNYAQVKDAKAVVDPVMAVDTNIYYIIAPTAIGSPGSSNPSTSKLGPKFHKYIPRDMVKAQYILVTEQFKRKHLNGAIGTSM
jgi:homoserine O-acetyltransferase/O-succinyltransferase